MTLDDIDLPPRVAFADWKQIYQRWYDQVERAYGQLGHTLGFNPPITSACAALECDPGILLMGLNPAGSRDYPEHRGRLRYEYDDIYLGTSWDGYPIGQAPLQRQVGMLIGQLQRRVGDRGPLRRFARDHIVSASFIPFRSPSESRLTNRVATLGFAREFWGRFLGVWKPQYAVCFGTTPFNELSSLLGDCIESREYDPQWQGALRVRVFPDGTRLLGVPHMSRFPIFGRGKSAGSIEAAFNDLFGLRSETLAQRSGLLVPARIDAA